MLKIFFLSIVLSIDALFFGLTFGINKIKLPPKSAFTMTLTALAIILSALYLGDKMYSLLPYSKLLGGFLLIAIGIYIAADTHKKPFTLKSILQNPKLSDINHNGQIETAEAMAIGIALSTDSFAVVVSTAYLGIFLPIFIMSAQLILLILGMEIGKKIKPNINSKYIALISGLIIIIMGFCQLK